MAMTAHNIWVIAGVAVLAGTVGGVAGRLIAAQPEKKPVRGAIASAGDVASVDENRPAAGDPEARISRLEREVLLLKRDRLIARAAADSRDGGTGATIDDPLFETAVRDVVERRDAERDDERRVRRQERIKGHADRWANDLAAKLGLSDDQKRKVAELVRGQLESMARLREGDGDGGAPAGRGQWRQRMRAEREKMETSLAALLSPAQITQMKQLQEDGELGAPWGGRRRGD